MGTTLHAAQCGPPCAPHSVHRRLSTVAAHVSPAATAAAGPSSLQGGGVAGHCPKVPKPPPQQHGFGIIGCGMISGFHAAAIRELGPSVSARLVACYDRNAGAARNFGAEHDGCAVYTDLDQMLADPTVTVVTVCTPSGAHMEPAVAAARAGKHVVVEKPLEVTLSRCDAIIDACTSAGVTLGTVMPTRFHESSEVLHQGIEQGRFGRLTSGSAYVKWYRSQSYYDSGAWRGTWSLDGGGALMNQGTRREGPACRCLVLCGCSGAHCVTRARTPAPTRVHAAIHSVDMLLWVMGPVRAVRGASLGTLAHERVEVEDTVSGGNMRPYDHN
jgi:UDP-N-acetyl-2-amino-2-deoxyglucuronate dehydrogenase